MLKYLKMILLDLEFSNEITDKNIKITALESAIDILENMRRDENGNITE